MNFLSFPSTCKIEKPKEKLFCIPDTFLSFTIDISFLLGGKWWSKEKGMKRGVSVSTVDPLDIKNPALIHWSKYLSPFLIRVGGTEADRVYYRLRKKKHKKQLKQEQVPKPGYDLVLKKKRWNRLNGFIKKTGGSLVFTLSCGWSDRDKRGAWMEQNARRLITYAVKKNFPIYGWELGNEINGYPFLEGFRRKVSARQYTEDFTRFSRMIRELHPTARAIGPASAVWPFLGELNPIIPSLTKRGAASVQDVISWHYYPQQSRRGKVAFRRVSLFPPYFSKWSSGRTGSGGEMGEKEDEKKVPGGTYRD
ncbi:MAG TPA: hypothetical protein PLG79_12695 [Spirochaetales bacterium]|nr:hypothetical protein [Spirochaetales bacterium]HOV39579.1 hypothetical protein [Spirochaetales bacterium]